MIIRIRAKDGPNLFIPIPMGLFFNRFTAGIAAKAASEEGVTLSAQQMNRLFTAFRRYRRTHPDWVLVEVHSADGDDIYIRL